MNIIIIVVAVTAGVILGGTAIYVYQGKCRQKELKLLAECMEKILREEKIRETKAGEETLYARLESRLVRIQEMLNGRTEAAEKSKDEIQKLISEIAHQMRTPLANIRTYQELLEEEWSNKRGFHHFYNGRGYRIWICHFIDYFIDTAFRCNICQP